MISPRPYQRDGLDAIIAEFKTGRVSTLADMATGTGKSLADSEPVLTPFGFRPMGELSVGDFAVGRNGKPTRIAGVYPQGRLSVFRVTFDDGTYSRCSADHLWAVQTRDDKAHGRALKVLTTNQISESISREWYVPVSEPWAGYTKLLPVDPYLLGILIGDGSLTGNVVFSSADNEIVRDVSKIVSDMSFRLTLKHCGAYDYRITVTGRGRKSNPLRDALRRMKLQVKSDAKFIPAEYKTAGRSQRLDLLRGLMDSDGSCAKNGSAEFSTTSPRLAEDVAELIRSLGGVTSVRRRRLRTTYHHNGEGRIGKQSYRVTVNTPDNPFRLSRKAERYTHPSRNLTKRIVSVEPDGAENCTCIKVEAADSLFLTRSYIVTHNTYFFAWLAMLLGGRVLVVVHREILKQQAIEKIKRVCPDVSITVEQGEHRGDRRGDRNLFDAGSPIVVASKDTLSRPKRLARYRRDDFDFVIIDEAHRAVKKNESYAAIVRYFCRAPIGNGTAKLVGVSASLDRLDGEALGGMFQSVAYRYGLGDAIDDGYLLEPKVKRALVKDVKLRSLPTSRTPDGKRVVSMTALDRAMNNRRYAYGVAKPLLELAGRTKQGVVFCSSERQAQTQCNVLNAESPGSATLCIGEPYQSAAEQQNARDRMAAKDVQFLVTIDVLTEGWDYDGCEIVVLKPSASRSRIAQQAGRGTRPLDGCVDVWDTPEDRKRAIAASPKPWCTLLDPCGASEEHSLVHITDIFKGRYSAAFSKPPGASVSRSAPADLAERRARRAALDALEEEKLSGLAVEVEYELLDTEMMSEPERKAGSVSKALLTHPATERQCRFLEKHGYRVPVGMTKREAGDAISAIRARIDAEPASDAQKRLLVSLGLPWLVTKGEARKLLDDAFAKQGAAQNS